MSDHPSLLTDVRTARPQLTARQHRCLELAARGLSSRQIGRRLQLSARTVDEHVFLACRALGVRTRVQAAAKLAALSVPATRRGPDA